MTFPFKFEMGEEVVCINNTFCKVYVLMRLIDQDTGLPFYHLGLCGSDGMFLESAETIELRFTRVN